MDHLIDGLRVNGFDITVNRYKGDGDVGISEVCELIVDNHAVVSTDNVGHYYLFMDNEDLLCPFTHESPYILSWLIETLQQRA